MGVTKVDVIADAGWDVDIDEDPVPEDILLPLFRRLPGEEKNISFFANNPLTRCVRECLGEMVNQISNEMPSKWMKCFPIMIIDHPNHGESRPSHSIHSKTAAKLLQLTINQASFVWLEERKAKP